MSRKNNLFQNGLFGGQNRDKMLANEYFCFFFRLEELASEIVLAWIFVFFWVYLNNVHFYDLFFIK